MVKDLLSRKELFAIWSTSYLNCIAVNTPTKFPSFRDFCETAEGEMFYWEDLFTNDKSEDPSIVINLDGKQISNAIMQRVTKAIREKV